jgi:hypothetical protein
MMTVRFPDGTSFVYNEADWACRSANGFTDLYTTSDKEKRKWIAQVPNSCLIEVRPACRIYNTLTNEGTIQTLLASMRNFGMYSDEMRALIELKKELSKLNSRSRTWRQ